jgi:hypothetical protein
LDRASRRTLHGFTPDRLTPAELGQALNWTGPNCSIISGRLLLLRNNSARRITAIEHDGFEFESAS